MLRDGIVETGPTVYEAAEARIAKNRKLIVELEEQIAHAQVILRTQRYANMLECERVASEADALLPPIFPKKNT